MDVIVIGAGFAGLSAASALAERGRRVLVLEARPTLGGRASAFTDPGTGERVDNGQHVLLGCYHETFRFLQRIGAATHVRVQPSLTIDMVDRAGRPSRLTCPGLPSPWHLLGGVLGWKALGWRDRLAISQLGGVLLQMRRLRRAGADAPASAFAVRENETVRQWLVRHGQTSRSIELLWEPLAVAALNQPIDLASAAPFGQVLARMLGGSAGDAALALPVRPLDELYALPARAFIEARGGVVSVNAPTRISWPTVHVRNETMTPRSVICAVPWHALPETFDPWPPELAPVLDAATRTAPSPIVTVNLWFDRVVTEQSVIGLPGRTLQWVFNKRTVFGEQSSHLSLVSSGAESVVARSNRELVDLAVRDVAASLPAARTADLRRAVVVREKRATFSVAPGQPARPSTRTGIPGLFLAGDWIETGLPATIEGAVVSGHWASEAVTEYLQ